MLNGYNYTDCQKVTEAKAGLGNWPMSIFFGKHNTKQSTKSVPEI
jgi:hypothetical protein